MYTEGLLVGDLLIHGKRVDRWMKWDEQAISTVKLVSYIFFYNITTLLPAHKISNSTKILMMLNITAKDQAMMKMCTSWISGTFY